MSTEAATPLHCPRCLTSRMLEQTWAGVPIHICMRCGANLFSHGDLAAWEGWSRDIPPEAERALVRTVAKVHCPRCQALMEHVAFPLDPPFEIERCSGCRAILLDFEEIRRMPEIGRWASRHRSA